MATLAMSAHGLTVAGEAATSGSEGSSSGEAPSAASAAPEERPAPETPAEFPRTVPEGVPSLQMSSEFSSPTLALGAYRPIGQVVSRGVRNGPVTARAWLQAGLGYDDNVGLTNTNKVSSFFLTVNPSISLGLEGQFHRYFALYRGSYSRYSQGSFGNYDNHNLSLVAADEWTTQFRTSFQYDYIRGVDPRGATTAASLSPQAWSMHAARATVGYGGIGARGALRGSVGYLQRRYDEQLAGDIRDYDQYDIGAGFSYRIAPKTNALFDIRRAEITHKSAPALDNAETSYLVGARWEATAKTVGTARVGYITKEFSAAGVPDASSPSYQLDVTWSPLTYSSITATGRRSFSEALELGSTSVIDTYGALGWDHVWADRVRSSLRAGYGRLNYEGLGRTDSYQSFLAQGSFRLERWLFLGAQYRHDVRSSNFPGVEYNRNIVLFTVESAI